MLCLAAGILTGCEKPVAIDYSGPTAGWDVVTGSTGGGQFSPLTQIDKTNVDRLEIAWTYESPDFKGPGGYGGEGGGSDYGHQSSSVSVNPIVAGGKMLICTPLHRVVALDPETGEELWSHDPKMDMSTPSHSCRGVAVWSDAKGSDSASAFCADRVLSFSGDGRLIALDLESGSPCPGFGRGGTVDITEGLGPKKQTDIFQTSPPLVVGDRIITGLSVRDGFSTDIVGGGVRAYDARTGNLEWLWDAAPPGSPPVTAEDVARGEIVRKATPNVWTLMSADIDNDLLFVPTGNPSLDYYKGEYEGGERDDLTYYGTSVVALRASTGEVVWNFQVVHHDLWDYDVATQPALYEHRNPDGSVVPALAVASKPGHIFLLHRLTGEPIFPVEERPVPQSDVPGEKTSPTQPFPTAPAPVFPARLTEDDIITYPLLSKGCMEQFRALRNEGVFTPPSLQKTIQYPANPGGFNWGGMAIDPESGVMVSSYLNMLFYIQLEPRTDTRTAAEDDDPVDWSNHPQYGTPYRATIKPVLSDLGMPCNKPPWGLIVAFNLWTGEKLWEKPLGDLNTRVPLVGRFFDFGGPVSGGPIQTASGLVFIGGSSDENFHAYAAASGELLWRARLPFSGHATPMTYRLSEDSKQYVVIASGGSAALDTRSGNILVAFTLPD